MLNLAKFTQSQPNENTLKSNISEKDESPRNRLEHLLIQDDEETTLALKNNTKCPTTHAVIMNFVRKYGKRFESNFKRIFNKANFTLEDILLTADIRGMQPSEVVARIFDEKGYHNSINKSDLNILKFHAELNHSERRKLRQVVYEDIDRIEQNKKWIILLPELASLNEEQSKFVLSAIKTAKNI